MITQADLDLVSSSPSPSPSPYLSKESLVEEIRLVQSYSCRLYELQAGAQANSRRSTDASCASACFGSWWQGGNEIAFGLNLLHLFVVDLLGRSTIEADIFKAKSTEEGVS